MSSGSGRTRPSPASASRESVMYSGFAGIVSRTVLLSSAMFRAVARSLT